VADTENTLELLPTMGWVCRTLGLSPASVEGLVTRGELSAPTRKGSDLVFVEDEVLALVGKVSEKGSRGKKSKRDEGELEACLFAHFKAGLSKEDIVIRERVPSRVVNAAYAEYRAGFHSGVDNSLRGKLELLARKERLESIKLEQIEARGRNRDSRLGVKADLERAKVHEKTMSLIVGAKK
jgi:hypothetical protein